MLISVDNLTKYINEKCIVKKGSFTIEENDKVALIGVNGTGKSTLMKILAGIETYEEGKIIKKNGLKVHFLHQNPSFTSKTIWEEIVSINEKNNHKVEDYEMKTILTKLGLNDFDKQIDVLSGGQRKRLALACALLTKCDLLLLDEPTNHLDNFMVEWLENYLIKMNTALLMVTHDRYFLDSICNKIIELDQGDLYIHKGNYEVYLKNKETRIELENQAIAKHKNLYNKELAWVRAGVQARSTKSKARLDRFEELRNMRFKEQEKSFELVSLTKRLGKKTIEWSGLGFGYDENLLFKDFSYSLLRTDRIGIIGPNGCGKSTLLEILSGNLKPTLGSIEFGDTVSIGYFRQGDKNVDTSMRVIDYIEEVAQVIEYKKQMITAAGMLERFLFDRNMHYTTIDRLSGGERRRLYLCRVLMQAPNILFLDEPTNDLDITTLDILEDYLDDFSGAIITVSHDRYFLDRVCDKVFVHQDDLTFKPYVGGYSDYVLKSKEEKEVHIKEKKVYKRPKQNKLTYMEKKEYEEISAKMPLLEDEIARLNEVINEVASDYEKLKEATDKRDQIEEELEILTMRWVELEEKQEGLS
jgi:ATP-binding cassette subfamily F protein uup